MKQPDQLIQRSEELIFQQCYAPVDLERMLASAETRSRIRRLPVAQLFYGAAQLEGLSLQQLLPHITEEQWTGILDLALWCRDKVDLNQYLRWQQHILHASDPVARKLIRAADPELLQLLVGRRVQVYPQVDSELPDLQQDGRDWMVTPDQNYLIVFPADSEEAKVLRALLERFYALEPEKIHLALSEALARTSVELEERAYQLRKHRVEDWGFQDYFDAIEIYTALEAGQRLPEKQWDSIRPLSLTPSTVPREQTRLLLLIEVLSQLRRPQEIQALLEELFFVCNKVLSADQVLPSSLEGVKQGIRKAICGINLGLSCWSEGQLSRAKLGVRRHYLQSFFQLGYGRLLKLQSRARSVMRKTPPAPGSLQEEMLEALHLPYPLRAVETAKGIQRQFFCTREDLGESEEVLANLMAST